MFMFCYNKTVLYTDQTFRHEEHSKHQKCLLLSFVSFVFFLYYTFQLLTPIGEITVL